MHRAAILVASILALMLSGLTAASLAEELTLQEAAGPFSLTTGDSVRFELPAPPAAGRVTLAFKARADALRPAGSNFHLEILLNGIPVGAMQDRGTPRLLNKPVQFRHKGQDLAWHAEMSGWRVAHGPDFGLIPRVNAHSEDDYGFVLDISDLVRLDGPSVLELCKRGRKGPSLLVIKDVKASFQPSPEGRGRTTASPGLPPLDPQRIEGDISPERVALVLGSHALPLLAEYTVDSGKPVRIQGTASGLALGNGLALTRTASYRAGRLEVTERITNSDPKSRRAVQVAHTLHFAGLPAQALRLGGSPDPSLDRLASPGNPSVFVSFGHPGVGMVIEDDALRATHTLFLDARGSRAGWSADRFLLDPGAVLELRYAAYPLGDGDYFSFINRVRKDWNVPQRLDGPYALMADPDSLLALPPATLKSEIERLGIKGIGSRTWWLPAPSGSGRRPIAYGAGVLDEAFAGYADSLRRLAARIKEIAPQTKVLGYCNMHRHAPLRSADKTAYAREWMQARPGVPAQTDSGGKLDAQAYMLPEIGGAFGADMLRAADFMLDGLGLDGLYLDEASGTGKLPYTYGRSDGITGDLRRPPAPVATLLIAGLKYRLHFLSRLQARSAFVFLNGPPGTMAETQLVLPRMVEAHQAPHRAYEMHLATPYAYTEANPSMAEVRRLLMAGVLAFRVAPGGGSDMLRHFFPITVESLGEGFVIGQERAVTAVSGAFRPTRATGKGRLLFYGPDATLVGTPQAVDLDSPVDVLVPGGGIAVIERTL